mgnify:CR=1 FL=1
MTYNYLVIITLQEVKPIETVVQPEENQMNFSFSRQNYCEQNKPLRKVYLYAVSRTIDGHLPSLRKKAIFSLENLNLQLYIIGQT